MNDNGKTLVLNIIGDKRNYLTDQIMSNIKNDIDDQYKDFRYSDIFIGTIIKMSQEFEGLLRKFIDENGIQANFDIWIGTAGRLLNEIKKCDKFNPEQMEILSKIIELRNWVVHEMCHEEKKYDESNICECSGLIDKTKWLKYFRTKLAVTKNLISEAIDLFNGAESLLNNSDNR